MSYTGWRRLYPMDEGQRKHNAELEEFFDRRREREGERSYYWNDFWNADDLEYAITQAEFRVHDKRNENNRERDIGDMLELYPDYVARDFIVTQFGTCNGYTTLEMVDELKKRGVIP